MTLFQIAAIIAFVLLIVVTVSQMKRRRLTPRAGALWLLLWAGGIVATVEPQILVAAARMVGIGRGVDLVIYLSLGAIFALLLMMYVRFRRIDEQLTTIVRHLAIRDAERDEK